MAMRSSAPLQIGAALAVWAAGCKSGDNTGPPPGPNPVAAVIVSPTEISLTVDETTTFGAQARDAADAVLTGKIFSWTSSQPSVASISNTGLATALTPGTTIITAAVDGKSGSGALLVYPKPCDCWVTKAQLQTARRFHSVGVVGGLVYAIGGFSQGQYLQSVEAYDPITDSWSEKAPLPTANAGMGIATVSGVLYAIGGSPNSDAVYRYDPAANSWTTRAPLPTRRGMLAVGVVNGIIYAVGGMDDQPAGVATVEAYNPATNSWTAKAPMPTPRGYLGVGVVNGVLFAIGGDAAVGGSPVATVEAYDPTTNTWTTKAPMPAPRSQLGIGVVRGIIYVVGGNGPGSNWNTTNTTFAYDPVANSWSITAAMPTARISVGIGVLNGTLYAIGGSLLVVPPDARTVEAFLP